MIILFNNKYRNNIVTIVNNVNSNLKKNVQLSLNK